MNTCRHLVASLVCGACVGCLGGGYPPEHQLNYALDRWVLPSASVGPYKIVVSFGRLPGSALPHEQDTTIYAGFIESECRSGDIYLGESFADRSPFLVVDSLRFRQDSVSAWRALTLESIQPAGKDYTVASYRKDRWLRGPTYQIRPGAVAIDRPLFLQLHARTVSEEQPVGIEQTHANWRLEPRSTSSGCLVWVTGDEYANPFCPTNKITYLVPATCPVLIVIYNVQGQIVDTLVNVTQHPAMYTVAVDPASMPQSGIYFYKLTVCDNSVTKKLVLIK